MSRTPGKPSIHAYAALPSGVHAIQPDRAVELIRAGAPGSEDAPAGEESAGPLVWIDVTNPDDDAAIFLRERCGFHPLAVEDCIRGRQRPKVDRYSSYLFVVLYVASVDSERHRMVLTELHIFLGERYLVTVHRNKVDKVGEVVARWRTATSYFKSTGWLAHALMDGIVDDYFVVLAHLSERAERIESAVFERAETANMQQLLLLRHQLVQFRRVVSPGRDVLSSLLRRDIAFLRPELFPYFQDVHDHTIRVTEGIDAMRELLGGAMEAQLTLASNQLNQTVRMLTAWSIILMSMALIASIYGMNFSFMPELEWRYGYIAALGLMAVLAWSLVGFFRRRGWL